MNNYLIIFLIVFLYGCNKPKTVLICGDHECINKSEAEQYLKEEINDGVSFFIADGIDDVPDVENIARLSVDTPLSTGADGLPIFLARAWQQGSRKSRRGNAITKHRGESGIGSVA